MAGRSFLTTINLNQLELLNPRAQNLGSDPGSPVAGQWWFNSGTGLFKWYNGTTVIDPLARANHSGTQLAASISDFTTTATSIATALRLNQFTVPNANVPMGGFTLTGLNTSPNAAGQAAEYSWVVGQIQSAAAGIASKDPVNVVATTAITTLTMTGTPTIDGVTLTTGMRVLLTAQAAPAANGVYIIPAGAGTTWTRSVQEGATNGELDPGALWLVLQGTANTASQWRMATTGAITVGTTAISIVQFGAANVYTASNGVLLTGGNFTAVADPVSLGGITVSSSGIKVDTTVVARKFSQTLSGSSTSYTVTHNLGTQDVQVSVRLAASTFDLVECDVQAATTNTVTLGFAVAPVSNTYRATVIG